MNSKTLLNLELNYTHKSLSTAFRYVVVMLGFLLIGIGTYGFFEAPLAPLGIKASFALNIILGFVCFALSIPYLPKFAKKYITITDNALKYKLFVFKARKSIKWNDVEEVEIDQKKIKLRLEFSSKVKTIPLAQVAYYDFEQLQKTIIDMCLSKNIDLK